MIIIVGQYMEINEKMGGVKGGGGSKNSLQRPFVQSRYRAPVGDWFGGGGSRQLIIQAWAGGTEEGSRWRNCISVTTDTRQHTSRLPPSPSPSSPAATARFNFSAGGR